MIGAGSVLLSWGVSSLATFCSNRRRNKRIRSMLYLEMQLNLNLLNSYMEFVDENSKSVASGIVMHKYMPQVWRHRVWESLTESIPLALNPTEIRDTFLFHQRFDELDLLRANGKDLPSEQIPLWAGKYVEQIQRIQKESLPFSVKDSSKEMKAISGRAS